MANFNQVYNFIARNAFSTQVRKMTRDADRFAGKLLKADAAAKLKTRSIRQLGKAIASTGMKMSLFATLPLALMGRSMIRAGSDAVETKNKFNEVFSDVGKESKKAAADLSKNFGIARSTAEKLLGGTGDLLVGFKFTGKAALDLSIQVNELAADLASFQNLEGGTERASLALTKALLGETESAKSLGIVIRQTSPEFLKLVKGFQRSHGATLDQAKAMTVLIIAQRQSAKAMGDVSRTWNDYAPTARRASEKTLELKEKFGALLLPMALKLTNQLIKLVEWIGALPDPIKNTILVIGGIIAVLGPFLLLLGGLISIAPFVATAITVMFGPIGVAVMAIAAVVAGLKYLKSFNMGAGESTGGRGGRSARKRMKEVELLGGANAIEGTIDVNINAPEGVVKSVRSRRQRRGVKLNTGLNTVASS